MNILDAIRHIYTVIAVPDYPRKFPAGIVVMARIAEDKVIAEHNITDRLLWQELVRAGIPRERIILTYAGEPQA
ncbi:MAG: XisI protein [Chloroflexi bacterium]|nr:XisI protein [Chloroflexota bacterium]